MTTDIPKRSWTWFCGGLALALTGCGESTGSVKGKVYLQDKLVTSGSIAFVAPNGKVATANIQSDGSYELPKVSTGLAKISVTPAMEVKVPAGKKMDLAKMGGEAKAKVIDETATGKGMPIPAKYGDAQKSELTYEVKPGTQEYDIKLQS